MSSRNCDVPAVFITRFSKANEDRTNCEYEYRYDTDDYIYLVSKLCRFNMNKISNWDQAGYKLVATSSYLLSRSHELMQHKERVVGILTYLILDIHQKTSEFLDLFKYIAYMPFSQIHRLSKLVKDKFDILIKTKLDVWMLLSIRTFLLELSDEGSMNASKPRVQLINGKVAKESLGMTMYLPSFMVRGVRHADIPSYIEEINALNIVRPKHLYGSQFMDKSIDLTAGWNVEFEEECKKYGGWALIGDNKEVPYPFDAKFTFCRDAILHAMAYHRKTEDVDRNSVRREMGKEKYYDYMHYNCSLRGCTKEVENRANTRDIHSTSLDECITEYKRQKYMEENCTVMSVANRFISSNKVMEFSMSEKDQRGAGRPIATPTLGTKAALMLIEKPEAALGKCVDNNIIVARKNKLREQSEKYKELVAQGALSNLTKIYQITEDQSKFSENDNTRKYIPYIMNNDYLDVKVRKHQLRSLNLINNRCHLVNRIPESITTDKDKSKFLNETKTGVRAIIGWPQGMLNFISTSVHGLADKWITHAFNTAYPDEKVMTSGLVHSDDSWVGVACNSLETFRKFSIFRSMAKKLFCLKLNDKKLWGSKYLGELVSNYNINGNVHLSVIKTIANSFSGLMYQNWVIDVNSQISNLQQAYRNGADIPTLTMMLTIFKQQILKSYQVKGMQLDLLDLLPAELGGYPNQSAFQLAVNGTKCSYNEIHKRILESPDDEHSVIIRKAITLSIMQNNGLKIDPNTRWFRTDDDQQKYIRSRYVFNKDETEVIGYMNRNGNIEDPEEFEKIDEGDYDSVAVAGKGDVFTAIRHLMPKSKKISKTIDNIKSMPFEPTGISMIVTRPKCLKDALGDLKERTNTLLYELAADHYTQSARRLAISQAIQSSGKTVRIGNLRPMNMNEALYLLLNIEVEMANLVTVQAAFVDDTPISEICAGVVYDSIGIKVDSDKRKIINSLPDTENKFKTICELRNVLLHIIDKEEGTKLYSQYTRCKDDQQVLLEDADLILRRFAPYFRYYKVKYACNLIMQQMHQSRLAKLWMQPYLKNDTLENFLSDLYGKTLNTDDNYRIHVVYRSKVPDRYERDIIETLYTAEVVNTVYPGKFEIQTIDLMDASRAISHVDPSKLDKHTYGMWVMLHYKHYKIKDVVTEYERNNDYEQFYVKPQRIVNGVYVGDFRVSIKSGNVIIELSGEPGRLRITSNTHDVVGVTNAMFQFTIRNFPRYRYDHPAQWSNSELWVGDEILNARQYLTYYTASVTTITKEKNMYSVPFEVRPTLIFRGTRIADVDPVYEFDESFRCLYKVKGNKKQRIITIQQTMNAPKAAVCEFVPDIINGIDNDALFQTEAIIHILLKRYGNISKATIERLLQTSVRPISNDCVINFLENLATVVIRNRNLIHNADQADEEDIEIETEEIAPARPAGFIVEHATTDPEDLEAVTIELMHDDDERIARLNVTKNLNRVLCKMYVGNISRNEIANTIRGLIRDDDISGELIHIRELKEKKVDKYFNIRYTSSEYYDIDLKSKILIYGLELDKFSTVNQFDLKSLVSGDAIGVFGNVFYTNLKSIKRALMEVMEIEETKQNWEELLDL